MKWFGLRSILLLGLLVWSSAAVWGQKDWKFVKPGVKSSAVESGQMTQDQVDRYALHFWDGENVELLGTRLLSSEAEVALEAETQLANFFSVLLVATPDTSRKAVNNLMDRAGNSYQCIMDIAEKYLYNVQSPYFSEDKFLLFLDHKIARSDIPEIEKSREKYLAMLTRRNSVGGMAEDFTLYEIIGEFSGKITGKNVGSAGNDVETMYGFLGKLTERQSLMIVFFSAGCRDCIDGIVRLKHSSSLKKKISEGDLAVLAVCIEGKLSNVSSQIPVTWAAASDGGAVMLNSLYSTRQTPSVYILERNGEVVLKDASVSSAIQFLLEQDE